MFADLIREFDCWADAGREATFWWRDDDAITPSDWLDRLLEVATGIPIALAVIPASAEPDLAGRLAAAPNVVVLQHGWIHANHALAGPNSEYPAHRSEQSVAEEMAAGRNRLTSLFGERALPVFAPPWHGFDDSFLPLLERNGLLAISRKGPRQAASYGRTVQVNIHVVPIAWTTPPSFGGGASYVADIVDHLRRRRVGSVDGAEPTGILTHHLVQNAASYEFMAELAATISAHPAARWLDCRSFFLAGTE